MSVLDLMIGSKALWRLIMPSHALPCRDGDPEFYESLRMALRGTPVNVSILTSVTGRASIMVWPLLLRFRFPLTARR